MKTRLSLAACVVLLATPALASDAMDKCVADTQALGAEAAEQGCTCFIEAISEETANEYATISDWDTEASDEMKAAGTACFPELQ